MRGASRRDDRDDQRGEDQEPDPAGSRADEQRQRHERDEQAAPERKAPAEPLGAKARDPAGTAPRRSTHPTAEAARSTAPTRDERERRTPSRRAAPREYALGKPGEHADVRRRRRPVRRDDPARRTTARRPGTAERTRAAARTGSSRDRGAARPPARPTITTPRCRRRHAAPRVLQEREIPPIERRPRPAEPPHRELLRREGGQSARRAAAARPSVWLASDEREQQDGRGACRRAPRHTSG